MGKLQYCNRNAKRKSNKHLYFSRGRKVSFSFYFFSCFCTNILPIIVFYFRFGFLDSNVNSRSRLAPHQLVYAFRTLSDLFFLFSVSFITGVFVIRSSSSSIQKCHKIKDFRFIPDVNYIVAVWLLDEKKMFFRFFFYFFSTSIYLVRLYGAVPFGRLNRIDRHCEYCFVYFMYMGIVRLRL